MRRAEIRLGDDFHERGAGAVEVHQADRQTPLHLVHQLGDVFFHVDVVNAQSFRLAVFIGNVDAAAARQREVGL